MWVIWLLTQGVTADMNFYLYSLAHSRLSHAPCLVTTITVLIDEFWLAHIHRYYHDIIFFVSDSSWKLSPAEHSWDWVVVGLCCCELYKHTNPGKPSYNVGLITVILALILPVDNILLHVAYIRRWNPYTSNLPLDCYLTRTMIIDDLPLTIPFMRTPYFTLLIHLHGLLQGLTSWKDFGVEPENSYWYKGEIGKSWAELHF